MKHLFNFWGIFSLAVHCAKWAAKPRVLSPLMCARYGWINVGCDMLKCSSCQAFLCASLPSALDFEKCECETMKKTLLYVITASAPQKYKFDFDLLDESRIAEISKQLQTQHEKFCPWPDFPCPGRSKKNLLAYINIDLLIYNSHCEYWYYFREVLAHSFQWTISPSNSLSGAFQEHLSSGTAAASTKVRPFEVYGEAVEEWLPFWILKKSL